MTNPIRDKVKTLPPGAFEEMARAAEIEIDNMRGLFLQEAHAGLERMRVLLGESTTRPGNWHEEAHRIAHNLKGQGTTFGYDLVTRIAHNLCGHLMSGESDARSRDKKALAHCEALRVILDKDIRGMGDDYGARLLQILGIAV